MTLSARSLLLLVAIVLFVLDALSIAVGSVSLVALGLAAFAGSFLASDTVLGRRI